MNLPTYMVKLPAEAAWIAWLTALAALVSAALTAFDVEPAIIAAVAGFILATGRLVTGWLLPTPTQEDAIADAIEHTESPPIVGEG